MDFTCEIWDEDIPLVLDGKVLRDSRQHPHASEWWEFDGQDGTFSMAYKGDKAFRVEFSDGWGIETFILDTPDYWRWVMAVTKDDTFQDEVCNLESAIRLIDRLRK